MADYNVNVGTLLNNITDGSQWRVIAIENGVCFLIQYGIEKGIVREKSVSELAQMLSENKIAKANDQKIYVLEKEAQSGEKLTKLSQYKEFANKVNALYGPDFQVFFSHLPKKEFVELYEEYKIGKVKAFRLIRRWLQSGKQDYSLLDSRYLSGKKRAPRNCKTKQGRPSDKGIVLDEYALEAFDFGVKQFMKGRNVTIKKAYENLIASYYTNPKAGQEGEFLILPKDKRPTEKQFRYYLEKKISYEEKEKKKTSDREFRNDRRQLYGRPADAARRPGYIVEADAVETDLYLVSSTDENQLVGRPVCYMMIDLFSHCIVAASVSFENNSNLALSNLMLNLFDDKVELGKASGVAINPNTWPSQFIPHEIRCDRGSDFASEQFRKVCKELGIVRTLEPPAMGSMKGSIEQCFRLFHQTFKAELEHKGYIQKRYDSDHKKTACITIENFCKLVYLFVVYHNTQNSTNLFYNKEMNKNKVPKIPVEIWKYGVKTYGTPTTVNEAQMSEVLYALMPEEKASIYNGGIKYKNLYYRAIGDEELLLKMTKAKENAKMRDSNGNLLNQMAVRIDPRSVDNLYYCKNGSVMKLYLNPSRSGSYAGMTWNEYLDYYRSEKTMDKDYEDYRLNTAIARNNIVSGFAKTLEKGEVKTKNIRQARKEESFKMNKENRIANRNICKEENALIEDAYVVEKPELIYRSDDRNTEVADLTSDTVPDVFKQLIEQGD